MSYRIVYNKITFAYQRTTSDEGLSVCTTVEVRITHNDTPLSVGTTTEATAIGARIVYVVLSCVLVQEIEGRIAFTDYCERTRDLVTAGTFESGNEGFCEVCDTVSPNVVWFRTPHSYHPTSAGAPRDLYSACRECVLEHTITGDILN